jgi:hypothetical protein
MMKPWYEDEETRNILLEMGFSEVERGCWSNNNRYIQDFNGGISVLSQIVPGDNRFDVQTACLGDKRDRDFFMRAIREHIDEMTRRINILKEHGLDAIIKLMPASG